MDYEEKYKEIENEQYRKWILEYLYDGLRKSDMQFKGDFKAAIAWFKKQGESQGDAAQAINEEEVDNANKVEPKFKRGVWISNGRYTRLVVGINRDCPYYMFKDGTAERIEDIDKKFHLWTIQDAKAGDVLVDGANVFIFHFISTIGIMGYCHINTNNGIFSNDLGKIECFGLIDAVNPATKEQRDILFTKMKEAGYEWDAEKKELKKPVPKFEVGDIMRTLQEAADGITDGMPVVVSIDDNYYHCNNELIAIKNQNNYEFPPINRMQNPVWGSKEDEAMRDFIIRIMEIQFPHGTFSAGEFKVIFKKDAIPVKMVIDWLKSLSPQDHCKDDKEQKRIYGWMARDKDGDVRIFDAKPDKYVNFGEWLGRGLLRPSKIPDDLNPRWEDEEPIEVEIIIKKKANEKLHRFKTKQEIGKDTAI